MDNWRVALYFAVTVLTTTGFGDFTLQGTTGRLISVTIMLFGVTLLFNLARAGYGRAKCFLNAGAQSEIRFQRSGRQAGGVTVTLPGTQG